MTQQTLKIMTAIGVIASCIEVTAQWGRVVDPAIPRDGQGNVRPGAPAPRTADGKPDFSGVWMRAESAAPRPGRGRGAGGGFGPGPGRGGAVGPGQIEAATAPFPHDPKGPPVAAFFDAGANIEGGLPMTPWAAELKKTRMATFSKDNPDALCLPMGHLQFHLQPQPRMIVQTPKLVLIEYEANYGVRHIYLDGRRLPPDGEPQPWWYGYSVGRWEGDTLVVETNNLRGAEDSPYDGWLDVNGSPHSRQATFVERIRRPAFDHLQIDMTITDPKAYTRPWTVRIDQRLLPDQELIEAICNENQQFGRRIQLN